MMQTALVVLLALAAADLLVCGALLAVVWVVHLRQRQLARAAGGPVPSPATGQFVFLAALGLGGIVVLYAAAVFLLDG